jgi:AcrR family transcriptional regulator
LTDEQLAAAASLSLSDFRQRYPDRATLVHEVALADLERQKREHTRLFAEYSTPVERLYALIQFGLNDMVGVAPEYIAELQEYPETWAVVMEHLHSYSAPQTQQLLNDGIRQRLFRSDINIQLVNKILLEQLNLLLNPQVFPPDRYNMAEVFRSIFLYYVRGLCTEEGARIAANHFAKL